MDIERNGWWIVLQGTAIVASILLAFSIEAWWSDKEQLEEEAVILESLLSDLRRIKGRLEYDRGFNSAVLESTRTLIAAGISSGNRLAASDIDELIGDTLYHNAGNDFESAALGALVEGGTLGRVSDPGLRQSLASIHNRLVSLQSHYDRDAAFHHNRMIPFALEEINILQINQAMEHMPGDVSVPFQFPGVPEAPLKNHAELLSRTDFQNLMVARMHRTLDVLTWGYDGLAEALDSTITQIEGQLE